MVLKDFLLSSGTDKDLTELILFLSRQARQVRRGFFCTLRKKNNRYSDPEHVR